MTLKTRVNLYSLALLPPVQRLSFKRLTQALFFMFVLFTMASITSYVLVSGLEADKAKLVKKKSSLDKQKKSLEVAIAKRAPDAKLVDQVELLTQQVELKQMLIGELSQREALTSHGYSMLFKDLARVANSDIWLNRIRVENNEFIFEGFSSAPNSVPLWVERLKSTETLKGHAFAAMAMSRGEDKPLAFTLTSKAETEEGK
ncbi:Fimbrial assembly protein (PilN) [Shewanella psychrophila]|uniref:Fimbrial assembly protein (PilN) n=1 Tax=Shewanella psychrophila TaxID=225848 RepID=A0A1S6HXW9_9GAMM|nr:PilN domain-containing protein [Shewanella psychrophila]AQS40427.1 Fimbrial assembly protein (PilN) [Shewanella psychrophila]